MPSPSSSPLLVPDESPNEAPSLSASAGDLAGDDVVSPLERLITMSTPSPGTAELGTDAGSPYFDAGGRSTAQQPFATTGPGTTPRRRQIPSGKSSVSTVTAATLCVLQFAFVWASYMARSWFDTYIRTTVAWQTDFLPMLDGLTAIKLQSTTLASILSALNGANQNIIFLCLIITSLLIPCLCMILCPTWTNNDHKDRLLVQHSDLRPSNIDFRTPRMVFEWIARSSLLGLFCLMVLDVGTSSVSFSTDDTEIFLYNTTRGGITAYAIGMFCALGVFVVLRVASYHSGLRLLYFGRTTTEGRGIPPASAFRLPWRNRRMHRTTSNENVEPLLANARSDLSASDNDSSSWFGFGDCQSFAVYQLGLLSCLGWLPALFLPMYKIAYGGLAAEYMEDNSFYVAFWEFPAYIWERASDAGSPTYMVVVLETILITTVYTLPMFATGLAVGIWTADVDYSKICRIILCCIHPMLCGTVFAASVFAGSAGFEPVTSYLLEGEPSGLCSKFRAVTDEACLSIVGQPLIGAWFVLFQSLVLELFVVTSLTMNTK